jgi:hypothetical protein
MLLSLIIFGVILFAIVSLSIALEGKHAIGDSRFHDERTIKKSVESYPSELDFRRAVHRIQ